MARFCQHCGSPLDQGARFCRACGKPVDDRQDAAAPTVAPPAAPPPWSVATPVAPVRSGGSSPLPKIALGLVVVVVAFVTCALLITAGPADAVTAHLNALAKKDDTAAYALTSSGFRSETTAAQFTEFVNANPILRSGVFTIGEREVSGSGGTVTVEMTAGDGSKRTVDFQLVNESDKWLITGYRVRAVGASPAPAAASGRPLVACTSTATKPLETAAVLALAPKTTVKLISSPKDPKTPQGQSMSYSRYADSNVRTFSIAEQRASTPATETVHFIFATTTDISSDMPRHDIEIELCDTSGRTASPRSTPQPSTATNILGTDQMLTGVVLPDAAGTYRIDAYVWLEQTKTWYLVGRMENVTLRP